MQIHLARKGERLGAFPLEEVNQKLATGTIEATDLAWYEGIPSWIPVSQVPGVIAPVTALHAGAVAPAAPEARAQEYAGFWIRVLAYVIDSIILGIVGGVIGAFIGVGFGGSGGEEKMLTALSNGVGLILGLIYYAYCWSSDMQASLGQKICSLRVVGLDGGKISIGRAIGRYFALLLAFMILLIGVILVAFTERKQGLHDMIAGTYVIKG